MEILFVKLSAVILLHAFTSLMKLVPTMKLPLDLISSFVSYLGEYLKMDLADVDLRV